MWDIWYRVNVIQIKVWGLVGTVLKFKIQRFMRKMVFPNHRFIDTTLIYVKSAQPQINK